MNRRARWFTYPLAVFWCLAPVISAQSPVGLTFDVASVKPNNSVGANVINGFAMPADRLEVRNASLIAMVGVAYGTPGQPPKVFADDQIIGGPDWLRSDRFDVSAKAGSDVPSGPAGAAQKLLMLRALLAERFRLALHEETREAAIYALASARTDGKLGPRLRHTDVDCTALAAARGRADAPAPSAPAGDQPCVLQVGFAGSMKARGQTMPTLVNMLSRFMNRVVVDRTGLGGAFDLDLDFNPDGTGLPIPPGFQRPASDSPSIFTAVQEQLGLKLESTRGPVEVLVIDGVQHPTED